VQSRATHSPHVLVDRVCVKVHFFDLTPGIKSRWLADVFGVTHVDD